MDRGRDQPEGGGGRIRRDTLVHRPKPRAALKSPGHRTASRTRRRLPPDLDAAGPEHALGMVSRGHRFAHDRAPFRAQARQQDRRLDLGAWYAGREVDGSEPGATDYDQRREGIGTTRVERRAHRAQRLDDTGHRTAPQRNVPVQDGEERQACQDPGAESQAGAGVAAVECAGWFAQAVRTRRRDSVVDVEAVVANAFNRRAQGGNDPGSGLDVAAVSGAEDLAFAFGQRREDQGPMRDRLVTGQPRLAAEDGGSRDGPGRLPGERRRVHDVSACSRRRP